jgi:hypothetical protein
MKATSKKFFFVLLSTLFVFSMLFPVSVYADNPNSTLGTETPYMYCAFLDANGKQVDGNALPSGDYTVDVIVADMANASILQFTASYDSSVITAHSVTRTIADDAQSNVSLGGIKDENDILVIALASENDNYTALDADCGTSIATLAVTIDAGEGTIDFEDYFTFSNDPDLTFLEADYADGYNDAYVTDVNAETAYNTYLMIADASPEFLSISAKVVIATSLDGEAGEDGIGGISIYSDVNSEPIATTASDGTFTALVPRGTKKLVITNHSFENGVHSADSEGCTIDREVTLGGKQSVNYQGVIPIIVCDYNGDGLVSPADKQTFSRAYGATTSDSNYNVYCNLNADNLVSSADNQILNRFMGKVNKSYAYPDKTLENE